MFSPSSPESDTIECICRTQRRTHSHTIANPATSQFPRELEGCLALSFPASVAPRLTHPTCQKREKVRNGDILAVRPRITHELSRPEASHSETRARAHRTWVVSGPISIILPSFFPLTDYRPRSLSLSPSLPPLICVTRRLARMFSQCIWADRVGMGGPGGCGRS